MENEKTHKYSYLLALRSIPDEYVDEDLEWGLFDHNEESFLYVAHPTKIPMRCNMNDPDLVWEQVTCSGLRKYINNQLGVIQSNLNVGETNV